jgi:pimeloyl-ACP methyl ester carboxylesterase
MKKPDILLLHGAIATQNQFDSFTPLLVDHFTCHTLNFSGHGPDISTRPFGIEQFAEDVLHWMDANALNKIDIFGYSMGGYVAMYLAFFHPEKVGDIFTLATKIDWTPENAKFETSRLNPEKIAKKIPAFANKLNALHHDWKAVLTHTSHMMTKMGLSPILTHHRLAQINHRVLIGVGDQDTTASPQAARPVSNVLCNAQLLILEDTPHPFEQVDKSVLSIHIKDFFIGIN